MPVTFALMGDFAIPLKTLFESLGHRVIPPPAVTENTIRLGTRHSPELACFPLKVNIGNYIESLERGADTIVMAGGVGPCRFGYYAQVQREILKDMGYDFNMIILDPPQCGLRDLLQKLFALANGRNGWEIVTAVRLFWQKTKALDRLHRQALLARPRQESPGQVTRIYRHYVTELDAAQTPAEIKEAGRAGKKALERAAVRAAAGQTRIALVGEVYMLLEPYANLDIESTLGDMGVEVERSIYLSDWIRDHVVLSNLKLKGGSPCRKAAAPYLKHFIGGHGLESIGDTVLAARRGCDGVLHILPFACTPEIVAQSILPRVSRDLGIPVMSLSFDEHSARAGFLTRLEAFVDLLRHRRSPKARSRWVDGRGKETAPNS
jgi:predicted nucleotide-binding protein (sugar kinase/HSP70/actin superfamily)